jgi:hypothetical protein
MNINLLDLLEKCNAPREMEIAVEGAFTAHMSEGEILHTLITAYHLARCERDLAERSLQIAEAALIAEEINKNAKMGVDK